MYILLIIKNYYYKYVCKMHETVLCVLPPFKSKDTYRLQIRERGVVELTVSRRN